MKILLFIMFCMCTHKLMAQKTDSLPPQVYNWSSLHAIKEQSLIRKEIMEGSTTVLSYFEVHSSTLEPGKTPHPAHTHNDREELIIIKDGQLKITIRDTARIMGPESIAYVMTGDEHRIENAGNTLATYYVFKYISKLPVNLERAKQNGGSFMISHDDVPMTKTDRGSRRSFFNKATSQLEKFELHTTALDAGFDSHAPHTHPEEEIILILKGNVEMFIAGALYKAAPGDVVFLPSGILHALKNTGKGPCEYFAFQWKN